MKGQSYLMIGAGKAIGIIGKEDNADLYYLILYRYGLIGGA